ncbi:TIGR04372 family glycosyltransferase [Helicobacter jaachi]|uniref:TIGR04372 family glycosyltransferase n=1 Tax=Helicobacter jaachi TaxID=1677920 RepID=UPI001EE995F1|nr:TIGR04372 family glycosyltransferase [Helicobacter jaachi]
MEVITYKDKHYLFYERLRKCLAFFDSRYVFELPYSGTEYEVYQNTENVFYFTKEEKQEGDRILQEMGIGQNDWFVCIFARDSAYLDKTYGEFDEITGGKAWAHHDYRDSDIDSLNLAIDEILARGGFVVRLGKIVEKAMSYKHARVIDYPLTQWRSDFMDIYLQYRAKFVLSSSTSGATDVVSLFGTHYCGANMPANWNPPYKNSIWIPKTYSHNGTMVSFRQWIRLAEEKKAHYFYGGDYEITSTSMFSAEFYTTNQLRIIDNTPEEILDLTKEMFERLDGSFTQTDEDKKLQALYAEINDTYLPARANKNPIGRDFLRKNKWFLEN